MRGGLFFLTLVVGFSAAAQQYNPEKISKKNRSIYDKALSFAEDLRYSDALNLINIALDNDPSFLEARLSKAGILGELKYYKQAAEEYKIALDADQDFCREYLLPYSINLAGAGEFEKALKALEAFMGIRGLNESALQSAEYRKRNLLFALQQKKKTGATFPLKVVNAGNNINSAQSEYFPSMTVDGDKLVWTRRVSDINEDFYLSQQIDGAWQLGAPMSGAINTPMKEGAQQISQDGKWLVFAGQYPDSYGRFDLYLSVLTENGWSSRQNLGENINSEFWESSPCLSPDKQELYFSSDRPGGFGGIDIYVSRRLANGRWSLPENLGPAINTSGDESSPFLHADNETLYFSSNGLQGYGGADLFKAKRSRHGFGEVQNLGYPVNTIDNEGSLFVAADGVTAWMASNRADSRGGLDIYYFNLPEATRPVTTSWVRGKVYDSITGNRLMAEVELVDLETKQVVAQLMTDEDGQYLCTLPCDRRYAFIVNKKGYLFHSQQVFVNKIEGYTGFKQDIPLMPIRVGFSMVLRNVLFETGKYNLLPASVVELDKLVSLMRENSRIKIEISGHTDNTGVESANVELSTLRAKAVADYLISKGIAVSQLTSKGYGSSIPVAENNTPEGRQLNRRTSFMVISDR
jgi:outer membrane protein OmpA-like peptidoglycan-associated protein/tetratricopeptide (TPR) repeat protein